MKRTALLIVLALVAGWSASTAIARPKSVNVPLKWSPNPRDDYHAPTVDLTGGIQSLQLLPIEDKREKREQIGENTEKEPIPIYSDTNVTDFLTRTLNSQFKSLGLDMVDNDAARQLHAELRELWVTETSSYHGVVRVKFSVTDPAGKELWTAVVTGTGENWGRSLKPDNYNETVCNAILGLIANVVKDPGFKAALKKS